MNIHITEPVIVWGGSLPKPHPHAYFRVVLKPWRANEQPRVVVERRATDALGGYSWSRVTDEHDADGAYNQAIKMALVHAYVRFVS